MSHRVGRRRRLARKTQLHSRNHPILALENRCVQFFDRIHRRRIIQLIVGDLPEAVPVLDRVEIFLPIAAPNRWRRRDHARRAWSHHRLSPPGITSALAYDHPVRIVLQRRICIDDRLHIRPGIGSEKLRRHPRDRVARLGLISAWPGDRGGFRLGSGRGVGRARRTQIPAAAGTINIRRDQRLPIAGPGPQRLGPRQISP